MDSTDYYYICKTCKTRLSATILEGVILKRIRELATREDILEALVSETNSRLTSELPDLEKQRAALDGNLAEVHAQADALMTVDLGKKGGAFVAEKLDALGERRQELEARIAALRLSMEEIRGKAVDTDRVRASLSKIDEIYAELAPYEKKRLIRLVLTRAELDGETLKLAFRGRPPDTKLLNGAGEGIIDSEAPEWLPKRNPLRNHRTSPAI